MLNSKNAIIIAEKYVLKEFDPLNSDGYFNYYFIRVGATETEFYAETFPNIFYTDIEEVKKMFFKETSSKNEYLIKVIVKKIENVLKSEIYFEPLK